MSCLKLSCIVVMLPCITYCMQQAQRNSDAQRHAILQRLDLLQLEMADLQTDQTGLQADENDDQESLTGASPAQVQISIPAAQPNASHQNGQSTTPAVQQQSAKKSNAHEKKSHNKSCCFSFLHALGCLSKLPSRHQ